MKSNISLVLFAMFLCIVNISCTPEVALTNLRARIEQCSFESLYPEEVANDPNVIAELTDRFERVVKAASDVIVSGNETDGYNKLFSYMKAGSIDHPAMRVDYTIKEVFNGQREIAEQLLECLVEMFVSDVKN